MTSKFVNLSALFLLLIVGSTWAMNNEDCFDCHDDEELTNAAGKVIHAAPDLLVGSIHEDLDCIDCHEDGDFEDEPHWQGFPSVNCGSCHDETQNVWMDRFYTHLQRKDYEGEIPGCVDCHGAHQIHPERSNAEALCLRCHEEQGDQYHESWHAQRHPGDTRIYPTCVTCHDPHFKGKKELVGSTAYKQEIVLTCSQCHQKDIENYVHSTHYRRLEEDGDDAAPACTDCHDSHAIYKPTDSRSRVHPTNISETCDACHTGHRRSLHKEADEVQSEVSCIYCHTGHQTDMTSIADRIFKEDGIFNRCNSCHEKSQHEGDDLAHGNIMDPEVTGREVNCTECHQYHWKVENGGEATPHWTHLDCGKCHEEEYAAWRSSKHGRSRENGDGEAASCIDCHGDSRILKPELQFDSESIVELCAGCHADHDKMMAHGVNPYVVEGYRDTYHGKLYAHNEEGLDFATCTMCHHYHDILESEDPHSSTNKSNLLETCQQCHEGANEKFVTYLVHPVQPSAAELEMFRALTDSAEAAIPDSVRLAIQQEEEKLAFQRAFSAADRFMKLLFVGVLSFFGLHTFLWFQKGIQPRLQHFGKRYYRRFSKFERMTHVLVNVSFLGLAFSGLPQSYSHTVPGKWFFDNLMSVTTAQQIHYVAALITGLYFFLHLCQLGYKITKHGWRPILSGPDSMVPRKKDFVDFWVHLKWFFGKAEKPRFDRWTYWEKFDYFAVFWGVAVIGISGLIRWKEEFFGNLLGGGAVSLADTIHKEEALMATAFIFIVHFFNTHFRSEKAPMDVSIYTGLITEEELKEERPEQYERMKASGEIETSFQGPRSVWHQILAYMWGAFALTIGLILLILIIWGMVMGGH